MAVLTGGHAGPVPAAPRRVGPKAARPARVRWARRRGSAVALISVRLNSAVPRPVRLFAPGAVALGAPRAEWLIVVARSRDVEVLGHGRRLPPRGLKERNSSSLTTRPRASRCG